MGARRARGKPEYCGRRKSPLGRFEGKLRLLFRFLSRLSFYSGFLFLFFPLPLVQRQRTGMVRTKANCGGTAGAYRKVVAARAPRKALGSGQANVSSSPTFRKAESKYAGGNPVCVRPTPPWQKGIGEFFRQTPNHREKENHNLEEEQPGCSEIGKRRKKVRPLPPCPAEQEESEDDQM